MSGYGCKGCSRFGGVEWRGDVCLVVCGEYPGGYAPSGVETYRGCGLIMPREPGDGRDLREARQARLEMDV